uniref:CARD domain-containing protein n=1 Tax=Plectus sambesii TaxID=2011161 RepID=A0A914XAP5_9BILA
MKKEHRELIEECRPRLIEAIASSGCLDELIDHLGFQNQNGDNGLTSDNIIQIKEGHHATDDAKAREFLKILTTRCDKAFDRFTDAIIASNQIWLIEILNSELPPDQQIRIEKSTLAASTSAHVSSSANVTIGGNDGGQGGVHGVYQAGGNISGNTHSDNHSITNSGTGAGQHNTFDNRNNQGKQLAGPNYGTVNQGDTHYHYPNQPLPPPPPPTPGELDKMLET